MNRSLSLGLGAHGLILLPHFLLGGGHGFCPGLDQSKREEGERRVLEKVEKQRKKKRKKELTSQGPQLGHGSSHKRSCSESSSSASCHSLSSLMGAANLPRTRPCNTSTTDNCPLPGCASACSPVNMIKWSTIEHLGTL